MSGYLAILSVWNGSGIARHVWGYTEIDKPFAAYRGEDPFIFVCYAHKDSSTIYPEISWLNGQGVNIWYDEGISGGRIWRAEIGTAISSASKVIFYLSRASLDSDHCSREINFAIDEGKEVIPIFVEEVELTTDLKLGLGRLQALYRFNDPRYRQHLIAAVRADMGNTHRHAGTPPPAVRQFPRKLLGAGAAMLVCALALFTFLKSSTDQPISDPQGDDATHIVTLAISPFERASEDIPGLEYEIERRLSASSGLVVRVEPVTSELRDYRLTGTESGGYLRLELKDRNDVSIAQWTVALESNLSLVTNKVSRTLLAKIGRPEEVLSQFETTIDPDVFRNYLSATALLRSSHMMQTLESAERSFAEVLRAEPQYAPAHAGLCNTYLIMYTESRELTLFNSAEQHCHRALTLDEQSATVHAALGLLYRETGQIPKAIDSYHRALSIAPYATDAMRGLAETYDKSDAPSEAERWFRRAIEIEPSHWENYQALGIHEFNNGRFTQAIETFETAHALAPNESAVSNNIGVSYFMLEDFAQAVKYWQLVAEQQPSAQIYANIAASFFYQREFEQAYAMYERAREIAPSDHAYEGHMAEVRYVVDPESAATHLGNAITLAESQLGIDPLDAVTLSSLATYQAGLGNSAKALELLQKAMTYADDDMDVQYNAAVTYTRLRQVKLARQALERLKELGFSASIITRDANFDNLY